MDKTKKILDRWAAAKTERGPWDSFYQLAADYVCPRPDILRDSFGPEHERQQRLFDSTAIQANQTLARGQVSYVCPANEIWFSLEAPQALKGSNAVVAWYRDCSERMLLALAKSNFYSTIHEAFLDRGAFGTCAVSVMEGRSNLLVFQHAPISTFWISEDDEGAVDRFYRTYKWTARQCADRFGEDAITPKMREALADAKRSGERFEILHAVYKRSPKEYSPSKVDALNKPVASCWVATGEKILISEGGFDEWPVPCGRFLRWGDQPYGQCPTWQAWPDISQLNFLEASMDTLAELAAFPRVLVPENLKGEVDFQALGITLYDPNLPNAAMPREWLTQGRYDIGKDRANVRREAINKAFHVDLFSMFAGIDHQMTAREVAERASEKLIQFSPTFARLTSELLTPLLARVFAIMLRAGAFAEPPQEALIQDAFGVAIPDPEMTYQGRIALALKAMQNGAFMQLLEVLLGAANIDPNVLDVVNFPRAITGVARNTAVPEAWLATPEEVEAKTQAREQAAAAAAQAQQAQQVAGAAADLAKAPPENLERMAEMAGAM